MASPYKHPKTGVYYFRRGVPADLQEKLGKRVIKYSLNTKDPREAKRLFPSHIEKCDRLFEAARNDFRLSPKMAGGLAKKWAEEQLDADDAAREAGPIGDEDRHAEYLMDAYEPEQDYLIDAYERGVLAAVLSPEIKRYLEGEGIPMPGDETSLGALYEAFFQAKLGVYQILNGRARGDWSLPVSSVISKLPEYVPPQRPKGPMAAPSGSVTLLSHLFEGWKNETERRPKTVVEFDKAIRRFIELHGDVAAETITKEMVREYRDKLRKCPAHPSGHLLKATLPQIVAAMDKTPTDRPLSPASVNKHLAALAAVLNFGNDTGWFTEGNNWADPCRKMDLPIPRGPKSRVEYSVDDLKRLFNSPVFRSGDRPPAGAGEAAFWLPLLGVFTGARLEELGSLLTTDIRQSRGHWYIDINMDDPGKHLKTRGSARKVPLHPEIVRSGFLEYVEERRKSGVKTRLFPDLRPDKHGVVTGNWSKWWGRYARANGVDDTRKVFHSFRHTFKSACRRAGIPKERHDELTGHRDGTAGEEYGSYEHIEVLARHMEAIRYEGLDLTYLYRIKSPETCGPKI
ncbi:MAG TPA: site-specific integrase [Gammaproteobacteria bacterium]|nr:site-specific integrase [Gammaproteobacteria bacterium]